MKIQINGGGKQIFIPLPTGLFLNRVTCVFLAPMLRKKGVNLTYRQLSRLTGTLNRFRHTHKGLPLVEVEAADGSRVIITL